MNNFADQLGYDSDLAFLFDFLTMEDLQSLVVEIAECNDSKVIEQVINQTVEWVVEVALPYKKYGFKAQVKQ